MAITATRWIVKTPGVCGGDPRIDGTRITVENVVAHLEGVGGQISLLLGDFPQLSEDQVRAALSYAEANREEIQRLRDESRTFWQSVPAVGAK
jgi:uncharacterized protein (DUF433 family)